MKYQGFTVTGVANTTVLDGGLVSTVEEPRHIKSVLICCTTYLSNVIEGWIGNERVLEIYDSVLDTIADLGAANFPYSTTKKGEIIIELDIPAGQIFKIGVRSAGVLSSIEGAYVWEPVE